MGLGATLFAMVIALGVTLLLLIEGVAILLALVAYPVTGVGVLLLFLVVDWATKDRDQ